MFNDKLSVIPSAAQTPQVNLEIMRSDKVRAELTEVLCGVEARLTPVLSQMDAPLNRAEERISVPSPNSPLAIALRKNNDEIESITARLQSILRRLEI